METGQQGGFEILKKGTTAKIISLDQTMENLKRIQEMGLTVGTQFQVTKVAPLGDPIEIAVRGYRLCMRKKEAAGIRIEVV